MKPLRLLAFVVSVTLVTSSCGDDGVADEITQSAPTTSTSLASVSAPTTPETSTTTTTTDLDVERFASGWRQANNGFGARVALRRGRGVKGR